MKKENCINDYIELIEKSWTWSRLTRSERSNFLDELDNFNHNNVIKGDYKTRWNILHALYTMFLVGCGYNPFNWREPVEDSVPNF